MANTYFITSTVKDWIHVFNRPDLIGIVTASLKFMVDNGRIELHAYVIMPNHIHLVLSHPDSYPLGSFIRDFHKFTAQKIILKLKDENHPLIAKLQSALNDRKCQLWQETHAPKKIISSRFYLQKINYIHNNPLAARWRLCERPEYYKYSSAKDYILGKPGELPLKKIER